MQPRPDRLVEPTEIGVDRPRLIDGPRPPDVAIVQPDVRCRAAGQVEEIALHSSHFFARHASSGPVAEAVRNLGQGRVA